MGFRGLQMIFFCFICVDSRFQCISWTVNKKILFRKPAPVLSLSRMSHLLSILSGLLNPREAWFGNFMLRNILAPTTYTYIYIYHYICTLSNTSIYTYIYILYTHAFSLSLYIYYTHTHTLVLVISCEFVSSPFFTCRQVLLSGARPRCSTGQGLGCHKIHKVTGKSDDH